MIRILCAIFALMLATCLATGAQQTPSGALPVGIASGIGAASVAPNLMNNVKITTQTTTLVAAGVAGLRIGVVSFTLVTIGGTTNKIDFLYGTQTTTPCDTGAVTIGTFYGTNSGANNLIYTHPGPSGVLFYIPAGTSLCIKTYDSAPIITGFVPYTVTP